MGHSLEVSDLSVCYGAIHAVKGISLYVDEGEIATIIGPNGAGKSSTLNAIVGLVASRGSVTTYGAKLDGLPPEDVLRHGVTISPEGRRIFPELTVRENLILGGAALFGATTVRENYERMFGIFPILEERAEQLAGTLSGGEQQQLAIARALMSKPKVLLLDEPSLGLAPQVVNTIYNVIEQLREWKQTVLLVDQNVNRALRVSDRAYVMLNGAFVMSGKAEDVLRDSQIKQAYFGVA